MNPSEIVIIGGAPLVGTFRKCEREIAAALLVLVCRDDGDEWRPVVPRDVGLAMKRYLEGPGKLTWVEFSLTYAPPDFDGLIEDGYARWVGPDSEGRRRPIEFTNAGLEALQRWRRKAN